MNKPEILAPAGGRAQLEAAVICGADAVYFGLPEFNARRSADNFTNEELKDTVRYCHNAGVKVYITLNTIIADEELQAMHKAVDTAAMAGVDALIVQDFAVAAYAKKAWPTLGIHASTQMAVHNAAGVKILQEYGFERIVLARELSAQEMRAIVDETGADTEVFVHGAHCMSVSGNCYMSSMFGGRSGNRGLCAQPCRLDWKAGVRDHVLSLKDMSYIKHLQELAEIGVGSLKIEGRMKRPEYVAAAVTACRQALDGGVPDETSLRAVFSRSGFTDGYYTGRRTAAMFGYRTKDDVVAAAEVLANLEKLYKDREPKRIPVDMKLIVKAGMPSRLEVRCGAPGAPEEIRTASEGAPAEKAMKMALSPEQAKKSLGKTGSTAYVLSGLECEIDEGLMLPASALNGLRRAALEQLEDLRHKAMERSEKAAEETVKIIKKDFPGEPQLRLRFENADQIFAAAEGDIIILPMGEILAHPEAAAKYRGKLWAEIPPLLYGEEGREDAQEDWSLALKKLGITDVVCSNIGSIYLALKGGFSAHGGPELNILNSDALDEYSSIGLTDACLTWEMSFARMRKLNSSMPRGFVGYGYVPLMKMRSCPGRSSEGCGKCPGRRKLTDRTGADFTLICRGKKYSEILNSVPLYTADKSVPPSDFQVLYFTVETRQQCLDIYSAYKAGDPIHSKKTMGLYQRELL